MLLVPSQIISTRFWIFVIVRPLIFDRDDPSATEIVTQRDSTLDVAKGLAILLVIVGHTLQGRHADFDQVTAFRVIYSFHMPLFAFLAGAAAVFWIGKIDFHADMAALGLAMASRVRRAAVALLLPFLSWTLISYVYYSRSEPLGGYLLDVAAHADKSLWFLPCIFWCTVYLASFLFLSMGVDRMTKGTWFEPLAQRLSPFQCQMVIMILIWMIIKGLLPPHLGLFFANDFHGGLFFFFALGTMLFKPFVKIRGRVLRLTPYVLFFSLVWYWHRTLPDNLILEAPGYLQFGLVKKFYPMLMAICGTLVVIDVCRILVSVRFRYIKMTIGYLGSISLAIYALHFYALGLHPTVLMPLIVSVVLYEVFSRIPIVSTLLFGR